MTRRNAIKCGLMTLACGTVQAGQPNRLDVMILRIAPGNWHNGVWYPESARMIHFYAVASLSQRTRGVRRVVL